MKQFLILIVIMILLILARTRAETFGRADGGVGRPAPNKREGTAGSGDPRRTRVPVQRIDDVIAIAGELGDRVVGIVAGRVGVILPP